jgi:hypothetical protein
VIAGMGICGSFAAWRLSVLVARKKIPAEAGIQGG